MSNAQGPRISDVDPNSTGQVSGFWLHLPPDPRLDRGFSISIGVQKVTWAETSSSLVSAFSEAAYDDEHTFSERCDEVGFFSFLEPFLGLRRPSSSIADTPSSSMSASSSRLFSLTPSFRSLGRGRSFLLERVELEREARPSV